MPLLFSSKGLLHCFDVRIRQRGCCQAISGVSIHVTPTWKQTVPRFLDTGTENSYGDEAIDLLGHLPYGKDFFGREHVSGCGDDGRGWEGSGLGGVGIGGRMLGGCG